MTNTNRVPQDVEVKQEKSRLSEGTRSDLERFGHAVSPFTGELLVGTPENYRKVDQDEYTKVARANSEKRNAKKESNLL